MLQEAKLDIGNLDAEIGTLMRTSHAHLLWHCRFASLGACRTLPADLSRFWSTRSARGALPPMTSPLGSIDAGFHQREEQKGFALL